MEKGGKIYIGLDMGTGSVGWAVTDENYRLKRAKGKDMWGSRLFDRAETSADRRTYRISRRRRERQKIRMGLLREYFADAIEAVDPGFYARLDESAYWQEDRSKTNQQKFSIFNDDGFTDKEYYEQYPTIFHLRKKLLHLEPEEVVDVRLVYLALANMFKHRGHFLNASMDADAESGNMESAYQTFLDEASRFELNFPSEAARLLETKLGEKGLSRSRICENTAEALGVSKKNKKEYELVKLMCGLTAKIVNIYGEDKIGEDNKDVKDLCFRNSNYEENEQKIRELLGEEDIELILAVKEIHDIGLLSNVMKGCDYLTEARVNDYEKHKEDLRLLKSVLKKYDKKAYDEMFREMKEGNYSAYVGSVNSDKAQTDKTKQRRNGGKGRSKEELYKFIKKILEKCPKDDKDVEKILSEIENEQFLPKQLTAANGVIPNQVYVREMKTILRNAERFLPFLTEKNSYGLTVSEQIIEIFRFQIPYYVGPLGQQHVDQKGFNVWAVRRERGRILPWNFEEKIDIHETAEKFIMRMVRHCTYLSKEQALPKNSLLYEKFMVLNELNNLRVNGERVPVELKQKIFENLFLKGKKVKQKDVKEYLYMEGIVPADEEIEITGIDQCFNASLSSYGRFCAALGKDKLEDSDREMAEKIIFWATVYGQDRKLVKSRIEEAYGDKLSEAALKRILGYKFDGWGKLSREVLEMPGQSEEDPSLISSLWNTNENLMELLSDAHTYKKTLQERVKNVEKPLIQWEAEDLDELYLSAPVKRMVWQTLKILKELDSLLPSAPDRIFVEMARNEEEKGVRKESRKKKLAELYANVGKDARNWKGEIEGRTEADFRRKKLYLYYLQMGRCMYTGEPIDLDDLFKDNMYDIDHIYPRHFVKDDSLENNLVLVKKQINQYNKRDIFPLEREIYQKMHGFWKELREKNFITEEKYKRLTRREEFTDEERAAFINRQLVETRQGTKAITQIIQMAFPDTKVVFSRAGEVSDFRKKFDLLKVRCVNDLHHAQDAYLNIVVGNAYYVKFTENPLSFIREARRSFKTDENRYHMDKIFEYNIRRNGETAWIAKPEEGETKTIATVKKTMQKNSPLITKKAYFAHGGITGKDTIWNADKAKGTGYIPVKSIDTPLADVTRYGGRTSVNNMGYCLVEYKVAGKRKLCLEALPVYLGKPEELTEERIDSYLEKVLRDENENKRVEDIVVKYQGIRFRTKIRLDGHCYYLGGKTGKQIYFENAEPLYLPMEYSKYLKKIEKAKSSEYYEEKDEGGNLLISREKNIVLWNELIRKLQTPIYANRLNSICEKMQNGTEKFCACKIEQQCELLMSVLAWFQLSYYGIDMTKIGGGGNIGICLHSKDITNAKEAVLILESATGLFVREVDLLSL